MAEQNFVGMKDVFRDKRVVSNILYCRKVFKKLKTDRVFLIIPDLNKTTTFLCCEF